MCGETQLPQHFLGLAGTGAEVLGDGVSAGALLISLLYPGEEEGVGPPAGTMATAAPFTGVSGEQHGVTAAVIIVMVILTHGSWITTVLFDMDGGGLIFASLSIICSHSDS